VLRPKKKAIISLHGIRTRGEWQKNLSSIVSAESWTYFPLDYGHFSGLQFAIPFIRRAKIEWFREQFNNITPQLNGVTPSVVAHSNGTYIVAEALLKYRGLKVDKIILCGSIVRQDFPWKTIFERNQATLVRNEIGGKDFWSGIVRRVAGKDTGPSGKHGFVESHNRLVEDTFPEYEHSDVFGYEHYREFWLPFLNQIQSYENDKDRPWKVEEPVSPYDAARWSAMTYFHQYVKRVTDAISAGQAFAGNLNAPLPAKELHIIIPLTPGLADKNAVTGFFNKQGLKEGFAGQADRRSMHFNGGEILYDIPTTLNTLIFLDNRQDDEDALLEAVRRFEEMLRQLITGPKSNCSQTAKIIRMDNLPATLV